ncbi:MAG: hypothetical protein PHG65_05705 [Kiritimatiellae bacterium]|nr:hypothetical protein [Kiritimatiellia bacterium]
MSYKDSTGRILSGILGMLESARADQGVPVFPPVVDAVNAALTLRDYHALTEAPAIHRAFMELIRHPGLPAEYVRRAFQYWLIQDAGAFADGVPEFLFEERPDLPWLPLVPAVLLLEFNPRRARGLLEKALANDPDLTVWALHRLSIFFSNRLSRRTEMLCRRALMSSGRATVVQQVEYGLFLLEAGRLKAAEAVVSTQPNPETPQDQWRTVFLEHMVRAESVDGLRAATRECLERHPGMPAFMRVFAPFVLRLYCRLEADHPHARDLHLAGGYAQILLGEWDAGRFHTDSLLIGSRFPVCAGRIREVIPILIARQDADSTFTDGFAAMSFYASCAGLSREAEECLELEPLGRAHEPVGWFRLAVAAGLLQKKEEAIAFLERLYQQEPDFFMRQNTPVFWSMAAILFKTLGWRDAARRTEVLAEAASGWSYRCAFLSRRPASEKPVPLPSFDWPHGLRMSGDGHE